MSDLHHGHSAHYHRHLARTRAIQRERREEIESCWCGETHPYRYPLPFRCDGSGYIRCECGGDGLCICHNHGGNECYGCKDCEDYWDGDDFDDDYGDEDV